MTRAPSTGSFKDFSRFINPLQTIFWQIASLLTVFWQNTTPDFALLLHMKVTECIFHIKTGTGYNT
jgi:hypothetical protein